MQQCARLLEPRGVLSLVVPDKRYCFDFFRWPSTTGDLLQAFADGRRRHPPGVVFDQVAQGVRPVPGAANGAVASADEIAEAKSVFERARASDEYIDVHAWRFTPASFRLILAELRLLDLLSFEEACAFPTEGIEFFVSLRPTLARPGAVNRIALYEAVVREVVEGFTNRNSSADRQRDGDGGNNVAAIVSTCRVQAWRSRQSACARSATSA